jgi:replicative DNA helicase
LSLDKTFVKAQDKYERFKIPFTSMSSGCKYHVEPLDRSLRGLLKNDVIIVGAATGKGKTTLANTIINENAKLGKKIYYFALEAFKGEMELRDKWQKISEIYYKDYYDPQKENYIDFTCWLNGEYQGFNVIRDIEKKVIEDEKKYIDTIFYRYGGQNFAVTQLEPEINSFLARKKIDIIVIDHLHFFDYENETENRAIQKIMENIIEISNTYEIPIIVISHLRKKNEYSKALFPNINDFHGSGDIVKKATVVIMLGGLHLTSENTGDSEIEPKPDYLQTTYFRIYKMRNRGAMDRYVFITEFDIRKNSYEYKSAIWEAVKGDTELKAVLRLPYWTKLDWVKENNLL